MIMELVWWKLGPGDPSVKQLQLQLTDNDLASWNQVEALQEKHWIMNEEPPLWGAAMLWRGEKPNVSNLPKNIAAKAIGRPPEVRLSFDVAASCVNEVSIAPFASILCGEKICTSMSS